MEILFATCNHVIVITRRNVTLLDYNLLLHKKTRSLNYYAIIIKRHDYKN